MRYLNFKLYLMFFNLMRYLILQFLDPSTRILESGTSLWPARSGWRHSTLPGWVHTWRTSRSTPPSSRLMSSICVRPGSIPTKKVRLSSSWTASQLTLSVLVMDAALSPTPEGHSFTRRIGWTKTGKSPSSALIPLIPSTSTG